MRIFEHNIIVHYLVLIINMIVQFNSYLHISEYFRVLSNLCEHRDLELMNNYSSDAQTWIKLVKLVIQHILFV